MIVYIKIILGCRWTFSFFSSSSLFIFLLPLFLSVSFSNKSRRKRQRGWDRARGIELVTKLLVLKPGETGSLQSRDSRVSLARLLRFSLWGMSTLTQTPRCSCEGLETGIPHRTQFSDSWRQRPCRARLAKERRLLYLSVQTKSTTVRKVFLVFNLPNGFLYLYSTCIFDYIFEIHLWEANKSNLYEYINNTVRKKKNQNETSHFL